MEILESTAAGFSAMFRGFFGKRMECNRMAEGFGNLSEWVEVNFGTVFAHFALA
jgi:hypothetical protein